MMDPRKIILPDWCEDESPHCEGVTVFPPMSSTFCAPLLSLLRVSISSLHNVRKHNVTCCQ